MAALFDFSSTEISRIPQSGLRMDRPATIELYTDYLIKLYKNHKIIGREAALGIETDEGIQRELETQFSQLDWERIRYMISADKKCKTFKEKQYEWSPSLAKAGGTVSYWKKRKAMAAAGRGGNRGGLILETIVLGIRDEGNNDMVYIK